MILVADKDILYRNIHEGDIAVVYGKGKRGTEIEMKYHILNLDRMERFTHTRKEIKRYYTLKCHER